MQISWLSVVMAKSTNVKIQLVEVYFFIFLDWDLFILIIEK